MVQDAMRSLLTSWGCEVIVAGSGAQMKERIATCPVTPDLDPVRPNRLRGEENGIDVIRALQAEYNDDIPAVLITGDTGSERLREARDSGYIVLSKPVANSKLRATIGNIVNRQQRFSRGLTGSDQTRLARCVRRLGAIDDVERPEHAGDVDLDGLLRQIERVGDLLVGLAERDAAQHLGLSLGQSRRPRRRFGGRRPRRLGGRVVQHQGRHIDLALKHQTHRGEQGRGAGGFRHIAKRAGRKRLSDVARILGGGKHDDRQIGRRLPNSSMTAMPRMPGISRSRNAASRSACCVTSSRPCAASLASSTDVSGSTCLSRAVKPLRSTA